MPDTQIAGLFTKARKAAGDGFVIAVLGWKDLNHNDYTRGLSHKKVVFYDTVPDFLGETVGFVLFTKYVSHTDIERIKRKKKKKVWPTVVEVRVIRQLLGSLADLIAPERVFVVGAGTHLGRFPLAAFEKFLPLVCAVPVVDDVDRMDEAILDFLTTPREEHEMSSMQKFAAAFTVSAATNLNGRVGKIELGRLRKEHGIKESAAKLVRDGWLLGEVGEGSSKVGWYTPTDKLFEASKVSLEPDDPRERAKFLIEQEDELLRQQDVLTVKLARVATAKKYLQQLDELAKQMMGVVLKP